MARFIEGADRSQSVFFPERLEDWIGEDNTVRVIDVFVDEMDLGVLGFERSLPADTGWPGYPQGLFPVCNAVPQPELVLRGHRGH
jgi:hypothetical protein